MNKVNKPKIIVYSTKSCSFCHSLMHWLDEQGVDYKEVDVEASKSAEEDLLKLTDGRFVVPITVVGEDVIEGFDRPGIRSSMLKHDII